MKPALVLIALFAFASVAEAQQKIGTVNLRKAFDGYWRTKQSSVEIQTRTAEYQEDLEKRLERHRKLNEEFRKLVEQMNENSTSADEKEKLKATGQLRARDLRELEQEINDFLQLRRTEIGTKQTRLRNAIVAEINQVVASKAKAAGYDLVLDTSGDTSNNTPTVAFTTGKTDITDAVLAELNANAPPDTTAPAPPPTAPKATDAKPDEAKPKKP